MAKVATGTLVSSIKAVIFDCFGVFYVDPTGYFYDVAHHKGGDVMAEELSNLIKQTDRGLLSEHDFFEAVAGLLDIAYTEVQQRLLDGTLRNTTLLDFAEQLRPERKVGLLSNISRGTMDGFFTADERQRYFDDVVLSGDVGLIKPDVAIFRLAAQRLHLLPEEIVFIDDNEANCAGARSAGMTAIHHRSNHHTTLQLRSLL